MIQLVDQTISLMQIKKFEIILHQCNTYDHFASMNITSFLNQGPIDFCINNFDYSSVGMSKGLEWSFKG